MGPDDDGPSPAAAQGYRQPFAIKKYFQRKGLEAPYVDDFVLLSQCTAEQFGLSHDQLPLELILADPRGAPKSGQSRALENRPKSVGTFKIGHPG